MHDRPQRNVPQIRRRTPIPHDAIGKHREGMWVVAEKHPRRLYADTAAAVGMIDEDKFAPISEPFLERGEFPRFGSERLILGDGATGQQRDAEAQSRKPVWIDPVWIDPVWIDEVCHSSIT